MRNTAPRLHHGPSFTEVVLNKETDTEWTMTLALEFLNNIEEQLQELKYLKDEAESTYLAVKDLLGLKQQQGGAVEARQLGEESLSQGRSIMVFTIITITFVHYILFSNFQSML
jgi:hypothetical protein